MSPCTAPTRLTVALRYWATSQKVAGAGGYGATPCAAKNA